MEKNNLLRPFLGQDGPPEESEETTEAPLSFMPVRVGEVDLEPVGGVR